MYAYPKILKILFLKLLLDKSSTLFSRPHNYIHIYNIYIHVYSYLELQKVESYALQLLRIPIN